MREEGCPDSDRDEIIRLRDDVREQRTSVNRVSAELLRTEYRAEPSRTRFERPVDLDGHLTPRKRARRADVARHARTVSTALRSAQARCQGSEQ